MRVVAAITTLVAVLATSGTAAESSADAASVPARSAAAVAVVNAKPPLVQMDLTAKVGGTVVNGGEIGTPTTWTIAGSPYYVTSTVSLFSDLTVEAGVVIVPDKQSFSLANGGRLVLAGTADVPIEVLPPQKSGYAASPFVTSNSAYYGPVELSHVNITGYAQALGVASVTANDTRISNYEAPSGPNAGSELYSSSGGTTATLDHVEFTNTRPIQPRTLVATNSRFGTTAGSSTLTVGPGTSMTDNVIAPSTKYSLTTNSSDTPDLDLPGNYWSTDDTNQIATWIWDRADTLYQPAFIHYAPFLTTQPAGTLFTPLPPHWVGASMVDGYGARVEWSTPVSDGGSPVTGYTVTAFPTGEQLDVPASATSATFTGLDPSKQYVFGVVAKNSVGHSQVGLYGGQRISPDIVADAPHVTSAIPSDRSINVTWEPTQAPAGHPVLEYIVNARNSDGDLVITRTADANQTSTTLLFLTNGTPYTVEVIARNRVGLSAPGTPSGPVTPAGVPGVPENLTALRGDRSAVLTWSPSEANGDPVDHYSIFWYGQPLPLLQVPGDQTSATLTDLSNESGYTFFVTATNGTGTSAHSNIVGVTPAGKPFAPGSLKLTRGVRSLTATWTKPSDNGDPVRSYTLTTMPATRSDTLSADSTRAVLTGLRTGTSYRVLVVANNTVGAGPAATSAATPPAANPGRVGGVSTRVTRRTVKISWATPPSNGAALQRVTVQVDLKRYTVGGAARSLTVRRLKPGVHRVTITSHNAVGAGPVSSAVRFRVRK